MSNDVRTEIQLLYMATGGRSEYEELLLFPHLKMNLLMELKEPTQD